MFAFDHVRCNAGPSVEQTTAGQIVVVDSDPAILQLVSGYFEKQNIPVSAASSRGELYRHCVKGDASLIILDLQFGNDDGPELLREIRSRSDVPIIVTTDASLEEIDRIVGLESGADDYIAKPFGVGELLARVRAVLHRPQRRRAARWRNAERGGYRFDGWQLERRTRRLIDPRGTAVILSKNEFALLRAFLEAPQRPLTREQLLQATKCYENIFDRSVDVQVCRLRRKLDFDPRAVIQTERGVGYVFALPVESY